MNAPPSPEPHPLDPARLDRILAVLIVVFSVATIALFVDPHRGPRLVAPAFDLALDAVALVVTASIAILAWTRYSERRLIPALYMAVAFLVLALANGAAVSMTVWLELTDRLSSAEPGQEQLYVFEVARFVAAGILVLGGTASLRGWRPLHPAGVVLPIAVTLVLGTILGAAVAGHWLPHLIEHAPPGSSAVETAPELTPLGSAAHLVGAGLYFAAATVWRRVWLRDRSVGDAYVTVGLVFGGFAQLHGAVFASTHPGPITTVDFFRLGFDLVLLLAIRAQAQAVLAALQQANVELGELRGREVERAALEERARLARELHDGLAQALWLAKLKVARLAGTERLPPDAQALTAEIGGAIDLGLAEARQAVMAMRIASDSEGGFCELLSRYIDDFEDRYGLRVEHDCACDRPTLPVRLQAELLRIAQEAMANAQQHAEASVIRVRAAVGATMVSLTVTDDGIGFTPTAARADSFGLMTMRERAALLGGTISIDSEPGRGTRVHVEAPVRHEPPANGTEGSLTIAEVGAP